MKNLKTKKENAKDFESKNIKNKNIKNKKIENEELTQEYLEKINKYWQASNYLAIAQQYLLDNFLLKRPLEKTDIKQRIVAPWGTVPGQNFVYTHLNRVIKKFDLNMILLSGPGHGGHFWTAQTYLDESLSEIYPEFSQDEKGLKNFCKAFCFPNGMSSHVAADMPGSLHEGGELGYSISHACGAIFDNPNLIASVIVGDGEAETGPLATSWHINKFINPLTDGAVLPILHLNGYKVANPTVLARIPKKELESFFYGCGWKPYFVEGTEPISMHKLMCETLDKVISEIKMLQNNAREKNDPTRPVWPMIVLRTLKGWTCPKEIDGVRIEGTHNAYHAPIPMTKPNHINLLEKWLKSYKPDELFDDNYKLKPELKALAPKGKARLGSNLHSNGGLLLKELNLPDFKKYAINFSKNGVKNAQDTLELSKFMRDIIKQNPDNFRIFGPDEMPSNRIKAVYEVTNSVFNAEIFKEDDCISYGGQIMDSFLSEHTCEGWLEGYLLSGRHGTFITYEAFATIVNSMVSQHIKWLKACKNLKWRKDIASLNLILTSHTWQQEHNGYSHQDPSFIEHLAMKKGEIAKIYFPPDTNCLLTVYDKCLKSKNKVNAIITSKHCSPQWLSINEAILHCEKGLGVWHWASTEIENPDVVIACAGDVITLETMAAISILKRSLPELKIRTVNVVDLLKLASKNLQSDALTNEEFDSIFTTDKPVIFNFHGYSEFIHRLIYSRKNKNFCVLGYSEEGNVSTPFDIRVQNKVDRFNVVKTVLSQLPQNEKVKNLYAEMELMLKKHSEYTKKYGIDLPEVLNWKWE